MNQTLKAVEDFEYLSTTNPDAFAAECRRIAESARRYGWIRPARAKKRARNSVESRSERAGKPV